MARVDEEPKKKMKVAFRGVTGCQAEAKAIGLRGTRPCRVTSPRPETDLLEAKQLRMCLLSKRVEVPRQKPKLKVAQF